MYYLTLLAGVVIFLAQEGSQMNLDSPSNDALERFYISRKADILIEGDNSSYIKIGDELKVAFIERFIVQFDKDDGVYEARYRQRKNKTFSNEPTVESLSPDEGWRLWSDNFDGHPEPCVEIKPDLDPRLRIGAVGDSALIFLGVTPFYSDTNNDLFVLCKKAGWKKNEKRSDRKNVCFESHTPVADVYLWIASGGEKIINKIVIECDSDGIRYGQTLAEDKLKKVVVEYKNMTYEPRSINNFLGLKSFEIHSKIDHSNNKIQEFVQTCSFSKITKSNSPFQLRNKLEEGTVLQLVNSAHLYYEWKGGMPVKRLDRKSLATLLKDFTSNRRQMAIVLDEYGGTEGLITLDDIRAVS